MFHVFRYIRTLLYNFRSSQLGMGNYSMKCAHERKSARWQRVQPREFEEINNQPSIKEDLLKKLHKYSPIGNKAIARRLSGQVQL